jgi:hypothetical protein
MVEDDRLGVLRAPILVEDLGAVGGGDRAHRERGTMGSAVTGTMPKAEVGILLYPGCQMAMVHGMTDMLQTARASRSGEAARRCA